MIIATDPEFDVRWHWGIYMDAESFWKAWKAAAEEILRAAGIKAEVVRTKYAELPDVMTCTPFDPGSPFGDLDTVEDEIRRLAHKVIDYKSTGQWEVDLERARYLGADFACRLAGSAPGSVNSSASSGRGPSSFVGGERRMS